MSSVHNVDCRLYRICRLIQSVRQISGKSKPLQKITVFAVHLQHNTHAFPSVPYMTLPSMPGAGETGVVLFAPVRYWPYGVS
jgi:hypothetical protein